MIMSRVTFTTDEPITLVDLLFAFFRTNMSGVHLTTDEPALVVLSNFLSIFLSNSLADLV